MDMDLLLSSGLDRLVLMFFFYSFLGWIIEVTLKYIQFHRFINRGFFTGPILPIYGTGAMLITLVVGNLSRFESAYGTTFALSFLLCGAVEYLASAVMEKRYHARWWDYSTKPMNLNGRIWIGNLVLFGLAGVLIIHAINPVLERLLIRLSPAASWTLSAVLLLTFAADFVMTHFILKLVKQGVESSQADNTEDINREIRHLLSDRSFFHRRFAEAYPEVIYRTERITARIAAIREETERLRAQAAQMRSDMTRRIEQGLEPTRTIQGTVIMKQRELIGQLYREDEASDAQRGLKREIDAELRRLKNRRALRSDQN